MEIFQLLMRILGFTVSLYLLLEYIVCCEVPTKTGIGILLFMIFLCIMFFMVFRTDKLVVCKTCNKSYFPPHNQVITSLF